MHSFKVFPVRYIEITKGIGKQQNNEQVFHQKRSTLTNTWKHALDHYSLGKCKLKPQRNKPIRMDKIKNSDSCWQGCVSIVNLIHCWWEVNGTAPFWKHAFTLW